MEMKKLVEAAERVFDKVFDFENHFKRSLFIIFAWYGLHFLLLTLIFN